MERLDDVTHPSAAEALLDIVKFNSHGLVCAIAQDEATGDILMQAWMNREAIEKTLATGKVHYYSRSRQKLWLKGESSGNVQELKELSIDCDGDTLVLKVNQIGGAACHTGHRTCFYRVLTPEGLRAVGEPVFDPKDVYK